MRVKVLAFGYSAVVQNAYRVANAAFCELNAVTSNVLGRGAERKRAEENWRFVGLREEKVQLVITCQEAQVIRWDFKIIACNSQELIMEGRIM